MAFIRADFCKETTAVVGTGTVTLLGARAPAQTIATAVANGNTFGYAISGTSEWEVGLGTMVTSTTFSRSVHFSSNANALVSFSAGTKNVDLVVDATDLNTFDRSATTALKGQVVLAATTEVLTGTDTTKSVTCSALAALWGQGTDNTGGATITLGDGWFHNLITSTTAITAFAFTTDKAGRTAHVRFQTARTLTHGTALQLPFGGASILTEAGDTCDVLSLGSGNFLVCNYERFGGRTILGPTDPMVFDFADDFHGNVVSSPIFPWTETLLNAGTNTKPVVVSHPGILNLVTNAATANSNKRIHLGVGVADGILAPNTMQRFSWVVRIPTITSIIVRLGLMQDVSATAGGTAGAYFEFDPASSANWRFITRQASASTVGTVTSAIAVTAGNWYVLEARRLTSGTWEYWVNGILRATSAANLPTTACNFGALVQTTIVGARTLDLDFGACRSLAQRFT